MTHSKENYKPYMAYLTPTDINRIKKYAKKCKIPVAQVIREAVSVRMSDENPYIEGFNDGITKSIEAVANMQASQMRFPSGKSFAELVEGELDTQRMVIPV